MKKALLSLGLFGLAAANAHGQWVLQNTTNPQTPPSYFSRQIQTVSATVVWQLLQEATSGSSINTFSRTTDGGATWVFNSVNGTANYSAAGIHALDANTAFVAQYGAQGGGEIVKTTNGGTTWTKVTTATQFPRTAGFANWVYFFDANNGVSLGDPVGGYFEVYTTSNGGTTWTRVPQSNLPTPLDANEYGLVGSYFALGNTIWAGTTHLQDPNDPNSGLPSRILKSTDRGLTWTASPVTPLSGGISRLAFVDQNNGLAFQGGDLIYTTNGGATWQTRSYTGNFNHFDIDAVPGTSTYVSVGSSVPTVTTAADYGSSYSTNGGQTWIDIDRGRYSSSVDFISRSVGYAGAQTDNLGAGGVYKYTGTITANKGAQTLKGLSVYPNPSATGVFEVELTTGLKAGAQVRVFDAVGRQVYSQSLNPTAIATQRTVLDLSQEKAGLYTLELRTEAGVGQQQLVIQ
ncbi:T9SS type A sorting domain-containing protein [Hymenobacter metallilatus]|uniref:T9SS C-terminal target domain-containing protein n=1 Tax=Hymenobacter metallilatus TaxID=2493666 RepID=A0A3R9MA94_9BACT|nr:T9SS type A sorting domain-containing protein [Hymenobacter metallilatus]RSK34644.1 T9SS C-terminal target domain-containing protein [Hymenobacter metallilatus]